MKKPSSAPKAQVAPSVPSFGAPLLPQRPPAPFSSEGGLKPRPQTNLGLIPSTSTLPDSDPEDDSDAEEEVDEEAALSALQNGALTFEFNGELSTLGSSADIAEWIEERKKRWPSKRRVEEKELEVQERMQERRRIEQETRAAIAVASGGEYQAVERRDVRQQRVRRPDERSARQEGDLTMEDTADKEESTTHTTQQPDLTQEILPNDHLSDSDSDAPPEQTSTKPSQPLRIPPPAPSTSSKPPSSTDQKPCISFLNQGRCKFGNKCRYKHDVASQQEKGKRKTLFQRVSDASLDVDDRDRWGEKEKGDNGDKNCANLMCVNSLLSRKWKKRIDLRYRLSNISVVLGFFPSMLVLLEDLTTFHCMFVHLEWRSRQAE
jgi:hypothetical protein